MADLRGHTSYSPKFYQFHAAFFENLAKSYVGGPLRVGTPSYGESWIRPCTRWFIGPSYWFKTFFVHIFGILITTQYAKDFCHVKIPVLVLTALFTKLPNSVPPAGTLSHSRWMDIFLILHGTAGVCSFCWNCVACQKSERVGDTESNIWIGNFNVKARKTILPKTVGAPHNFVRFRQNEHIPGNDGVGGLVTVSNFQCTQDDFALQVTSIIHSLIFVLSLLSRTANIKDKQECIPVGCVPPAHWPYLCIASYPTHAPPGATTHAPHPEQPCTLPRATMHAPQSNHEHPPGATMHAPREQPCTPPREQNDKQV